MRPGATLLTDYDFYVCDRAAYQADPYTNDAVEYHVLADPGLTASDLYWWFQAHPELSRRYELHSRAMILGIVDTSTGEILWTATPPPT